MLLACLLVAPVDIADSANESEKLKSLIDKQSVVSLNYCTFQERLGDGSRKRTRIQFAKIKRFATSEVWHYSNL